MGNHQFWLIDFRSFFLSGFYSCDMNNYAFESNLIRFEMRMRKKSPTIQCI